MLKVNNNNNELEIVYDNITLIKHSTEKPAFFIGKGQDSMEMYRGNFNISDYISERLPLETICEDNNTFQLFYNSKPVLKMSLDDSDNQLKISFKAIDNKFNRFWIRINANSNEKVYGCGEQLSYFNLRGRNFPLWTSEPGVGRDKSTLVTWMADVKDKAGGDYYNTNYPQSTFISTHKYFCHMDSTAYMDFNFKNDDFHELECWEIPQNIVFRTADSYISLLEKLTDFFGRQPNLPEWVYNGLIVGLQNGTETVLRKTNDIIKKGVKVAGIWAQDWQGKRVTSFGKRLNWNWQWDKEMYPNLDTEIPKLKDRGIKFLGYINPYLVKDYPLYNEAFELGYFAKSKDGNEYLVDFGEFYCGVVDLTNPKAFEWYKNRVIKKEMIDFGLDGWMADFGEYLPVDCTLHSGIDAKKAHNDWPRLWAKANYEAIKETGKLGEILFFMRAGFNGFQPYNTLLWAGDQCVDFSLHDGLASVVPAALSAGMSGMGLHHSDIGGYTSLHGLKRTKELFMRWADMAAFTVVMRTHEGNRPDENFQFEQDDEAVKHLAKMVNTYTTLKPYIKSLVNQNHQKGIPVQRPLFIHYENDPLCYDIQYQYLLGEDLLVAPVHQQGVTEWDVYLPKGDDWIHIYSNKEYKGGQTITVKAEIGYPPVFYKKGTYHSKLFNSLKDIK
ncbi:alpha-glucosidase [Francisella hispaniensis]|uniref:alpha-glucosidase n=1 Tax=Francisella hispaniensis TaxID=622488 RepID=UPI00190777B6|nr:alpha-glucosidase [Francisella hispaniensis]MBK2357338.1 alpha-glucosidase [Francisella hispaniensis]